MTGGVFTAAAKERLRRKAVMLIEKPFSPTGLRETIFDLLGLEVAVNRKDDTMPAGGQD